MESLLYLVLTAAAAAAAFPARRGLGRRVLALGTAALLFFALIASLPVLLPAASY